MKTEERAWNGEMNCNVVFRIENLNILIYFCPNDKPKLSSLLFTAHLALNLAMLLMR